MSNPIINPILEKIARDWNIEASSERIEDYFYSINEFSCILRGDIPYVLGRKGTGKTAISSFIESKNNYNFFVEKLSFKNFPFNILYQLEDLSYGRESRFVALWMTLIYLKICKLIIKNQSVNNDSLNKLKELYPGFLDEKLENVVKFVTGWKLSAEASIPGVGGVGVSNSKNYSKENAEWSDIVNLLETVIKQSCDSSHYYILFDELDENYREISDKENRENYMPLITSLFKAVQKVKANLKGYNIIPIVFLRNDIYNQISDGDKNKWTDSSVTLEWSDEKLKKTMAFRIAKADGKKDYSFWKAWNSIIDDDALNMPSGRNKKTQIDSWEFLREETMMKPRDIIKYLQCCSRTANKKGHYYIKKDDIYTSRMEYSKYLKQEITDEITPIMPYVEIVWKTLADISKQIFSTKEFVTTFNNQKVRNLCKYPSLEGVDPETVLEELFDFSVIGSQNRANKKFSYKYKNSDLYYSSKVMHVIHRGLLKALNIQ